MSTRENDDRIDATDDPAKLAATYWPWAHWLTRR